MLNFLNRLYSFRKMIFAMAIQDIQSRYIGTLAGFIWSIIHPIITILVYWFVFSVGLKVKPIGNVPFIVLFSAGLIPWMTFSEILSTSTNSITGNKHLVTKIVFPTEMLPFVNIIASLIIHFVMMAIFLVLLYFNGIGLSIFNIQVFYYIFSFIILSLGFSWFCSAMNVFYRDTGQVLGVVLSIMFWLTPVAWELEMLPQRYQHYIKFNPFVYIVEGYKASFIYHVPFWNNYTLGIYFWIISIFMFAAGWYVFKKLKPEFADMI